MEVSSISNTNFNGALKFTGEVTETLKTAINASPLVQKYISGKKDLIINVSYREATRHEVFRLRRDDDLYKITFRSVFAGDSLFKKFLNLFSRTVRLAGDWDHHSEHRNLRWIKDTEYLQKHVFNKLG